MLRSVHTSQQLYFYLNIIRKQAAHHHTQACPRHKAAALCSPLFPVTLSLFSSLWVASSEFLNRYAGSNEDSQSAVSPKDSPVN